MHRGQGRWRAAAAPRVVSPARGTGQGFLPSPLRLGCEGQARGWRE
nr:MAG TPA: hypothetical protein [Caudoviricetes sp.]